MHRNPKPINAPNLCLRDIGGTWEGHDTLRTLFSEKGILIRVGLNKRIHICWGKALTAYNRAPKNEERERLRREKDKIRSFEMQTWAATAWGILLFCTLGKCSAVTSVNSSHR